LRCDPDEEIRIKSRSQGGNIGRNGSLGLFGESTIAGVANVAVTSKSKLFFVYYQQDKKKEAWTSLVAILA
jgi:hypothetical protein